MLEAVRAGPWRQTVESHLTWKKQLLEDITTKQIRANRWQDIKGAEQEFKEDYGPVNYVVENSTKSVLEEIHQDTVTGFYIHDLITSADCPHSWDGGGQVGLNPGVSVKITVSPQTPETWKRTTEVRTNSLILLRDLLQRSTEWTESNILERGLLREPGPCQDTNRDAVLEQVYETSGLSPLSCYPCCTHKKATIISGVRERKDPQAIPTQEQDRTSQERYLDYFCSQ